MELKPHEIEIIDILASDVISSDTMNNIKTNPTVKDCHSTGHGYFIIIANPNLPAERIVCDKPIITGECNGVLSTFLIFIEEHELTIECAGIGDVEPPKDYRDWNINVKTA